MGQQQDMRILTREEATHFERSRGPGPWIWPEVVYIAISNTYDLIGVSGPRALNGDPLEFALAVRYLETLYDNGYVLVKMFGTNAGDAR